MSFDAAPRAVEPSPGRRFVRWSGGELSQGTAEGAVVTGDGVTITEVTEPAGRLDYTDPHTARTRSYDFATWTSPELALGFAATDVIASWTATTLPGTWVQTDLRGVTQNGERTKWFVMGRWAADDDSLLRTSVPEQRDTHGDVLVDRYVAADGHALTSIELRVILHRPTGDVTTPLLRSVAVITTARCADFARPTSEPQQARGVVLPVPMYSQHVHKGEYPQWDSGGEAWCSPTSTAMVLAFWGAGPATADLDWVDPAYADPCVHHAVRGVYDYDYHGAGNWAFNIAYAAQLGLTGFVTQLRSLREAERFIVAGIPLVLSLSFDSRQIAGLGYATKGHLLVLAGFSAAGDPVLNDPSAPRNEDVRKTVARAELEAAWLSSSHGVVYVLCPAGISLPDVPGAGG